MCHNIPRDTTSGKYVIKIPRSNSGTLEEWIIFEDLVQKSLVEQNVTTGPPMHKCIERALTVYSKSEFLQQANIPYSCQLHFGNGNNDCTHHPYFC